MSIYKIKYQLINKYFNDFHISFTSLFFGFFLSTILSTIPAQTGDWGIIAASIIVSINELVSKLIYRTYVYDYMRLKFVNFIKIGIIYGLFVDSFKLGS